MDGVTRCFTRARISPPREGAGGTGGRVGRSQSRQRPGRNIPRPIGQVGREQNRVGELKFGRSGRSGRECCVVVR